MGTQLMPSMPQVLVLCIYNNLLKEQLQLKNMSATLHCMARLKDYKLVFGNYKGLASEVWHGSVATIEHSPGDEVWAVVWRMNMESIDE
ncbi:gamma-glutamylcyclotransferase-like [Stigmatopora nigra]